MSKLANPPIIKQPRPIFTLGDLKLIICTVISFFIKSAVNGVLSIFKVPYNLLDSQIKTIKNIPFIGNGLALPLEPVKEFFGVIVKLIGALTKFFSVIFYVFLFCIIFLIILKIISRIKYKKSKKDYYTYHEELQKKINNQEQKSNSENMHTTENVSNPKKESVPENISDSENVSDGNAPHKNLKENAKVRNSETNDMGDMDYYP